MIDEEFDGNSSVSPSEESRSTTVNFRSSMLSVDFVMSENASNPESKKFQLHNFLDFIILLILSVLTIILMKLAYNRKPILIRPIVWTFAVFLIITSLISCRINQKLRQELQFPYYFKFKQVGVTVMLCLSLIIVTFIPVIYSESITIQFLAFFYRLAMSVLTIVNIVSQTSNHKCIVRLVQSIKSTHKKMEIVNGEVIVRSAPKSVDSMELLKANFIALQKIKNRLTQQLIQNLAMITFVYIPLLFVNDEFIFSAPLVTCISSQLIGITIVSMNTISRFNEEIRAVEHLTTCDTNLKISLLMWEPKNELIIGTALSLAYVFISVLKRFYNLK